MKPQISLSLLAVVFIGHQSFAEPTNLVEFADRLTARKSMFKGGSFSFQTYKIVLGDKEYQEFKGKLLDLQKSNEPNSEIQEFVNQFNEDHKASNLLLRKGRFYFYKDKWRFTRELVQDFSSLIQKFNAMAKTNVVVKVRKLPNTEDVAFNGEYIEKLINNETLYYLRTDEANDFPDLRYLDISLHTWNLMIDIGANPNQKINFFYKEGFPAVTFTTYKKDEALSSAEYVFDAQRGYVPISTISTSKGKQTLEVLYVANNQKNVSLPVVVINSHAEFEEPDKVNLELNILSDWQDGVSERDLTIKLPKAEIKPIDKTTNHAKTLWPQMQQAVLGGYPNIQKVEELLKAGFNIDSPIGCDSFNALDGAITKQNLKLVQLLLTHGAKPKGRALVSACSRPYQNAKIVKVLLDAGADVNYHSYYERSDTNRFTTPIHEAASSSDEEFIQLLLSQKGVQINALDSYGDTPLMIAARSGHQKIVEMFLAAGADPNIKNEKGETAASQIEKEIENFQEIKARLKTE